MAKAAAKDLNFSFNANALEAFVENGNLDIRREAPVATGLSDDGPRRVVGNYDWGVNIDGVWGGAAGEPDATIGVDCLAGTKRDIEFDPASAVHYDPTTTNEMIVENYSVNCRLGEAIKFSAAFVPNSALSRNTS
jgi:hypothetical protein